MVRVDIKPKPGITKGHDPKWSKIVILVIIVMIIMIMIMIIS